MSEREWDTSPGIPSELEPEDRPATGDVYARSTEGGSVGGPGFGTVITPPAEGGIMTRRDEVPEDEETEGLTAAARLRGPL